MQSPVPLAGFLHGICCLFPSRLGNGKGVTSLGRGSGTAEQLCSGSCDTLCHSWLEGTVSLGYCQYNAFQELDGDWLLPSIKHPGGEQWGWRWSCGHWCVSQSPSKRARTQHWSLLGSPAHLMGWRCVTVDHRVRQYFVTASLKELGITAEPTEISTLQGRY